MSSLPTPTPSRYTCPPMPLSPQLPLLSQGPLSPGPKPFLKWVGGKRQLLSQLLPHIPQPIQRYHEPFVGGGALFFALQPRQAFLSDLNPRLVRTWSAVRDNVEALIEVLSTYPHDKDFFLTQRQTPIDTASDVEVAAWMIYLNKTAYNGLYRVNRSNQFNVPFGRYVNPTICDAPNLRACSKALSTTEVFHAPFTSVQDRARPGDLVYFDPPYVPLSTTSSFTSYTMDSFSTEDQVALRDLALSLKSRGVHVLLSNSNAPLVYDLYRENFTIVEVLAARSVNSKAQGRAKIPELLMF